MLNHLANPLKLGVCQHAPRITRHSEWMKAVGLPQILGTDAIKPTLTLTLQRHRYSIGVIVNLWKHRPELIRDITRSSDITKRSRHSQECKNLRRGKPRASGQRTRGSDAEKTRCRRSITVEKTRCSYERSSGGNIAFSLKCDTEVVTSTFDVWTSKINGLHGTFGDRSCSGFWDIVWKNRQTAVKILPTRLPSASVTSTGFLSIILFCFTDYRRQRSIAITYKVVEHCVDVRWSIWRPRDLDYSCSWNTCEVKKTPRRQTEWKISTEKRRKGSSNALSNSKMNWVNVDNFVHQKTEITFEQMRFPFSKSISQSVSETQ